MVVPPGVPVQVDVTVVDAAGFLVEASSPLTVAWTARGPAGLAFSAASPVGRRSGMTKPAYAPRRG